MKQYNLKAEVRKMSFGDLNVIALGERGRGRYETLVPVQLLQSDDYVTIAKTTKGTPKIIKGGNNQGWIARISCEGVYTRGTEGHIFVHSSDHAKIEVLASGSGAEGAAGRIGYWGDYLIKVEDFTLIKVKQHGGYKTPPYFLYFDKDKVNKIQDEEIDLFMEQKGYDPLAYFEKIQVIHNL